MSSPIRLSSPDILSWPQVGHLGHFSMRTGVGLQGWLDRFPEPDTYNPGVSQSPFSDWTIDDLKLELAECRLRMAQQEHDADGPQPLLPETDVYNRGPTQSPFSRPTIPELSSETISFCNEYVQAIEDRDETIGDLKLKLAEKDLEMAEQEHEADGRLQVVERQLLSMNQLAVRLAEEVDRLRALVNGQTLLRIDPACPTHGHLHQ